MVHSAASCAPSHIKLSSIKTLGPIMNTYVKQNVNTPSLHGFISSNSICNFRFTAAAKYSSENICKHIKMICRNMLLFGEFLQIPVNEN